MERAPQDGQNFRKDIQGLRALAVSLVVIYHLWPNRLSGGFVGVDAFFVISGYLITAHLLAKPPARFHDLARFWSRRIRRLLPASLVVLAITAVATRLLAPPTQWEQISREIISSALYIENWALASSATDYLAADNSASPVQHFWSLSVEEQFYLFWPILLLAAFWVARRFKLSPTTTARAVISGVIVLSLAFSVSATINEPASAYFITPTRMWELAMGGAIAALPIMSTRLASRFGPLLAWLGVTAIVISAVYYSGSTPFPGYAALVPVLGTALVIWTGACDAFSPTNVFQLRPIQWLGNVSYSVYLWHWPLIALIPYVSGGHLGRLDKAFILVATLLLAGASKKFIEDRYRVSKPGASLAATYRLAGVGMIAVVALSAVQLAEVEYRQTAATNQLKSAVNGNDPCFGASSIAAGFDKCPQNPSVAPVPDLTLAKTDKAEAYEDHCWNNAPFTERTKCTYGSGPKQVALVGNSHAGHWLPALQVIAEQRGWTITTYLVSRCNPTDAPLTFDTPEKTENCLEWGRWAMEETKGTKYDLVFTSERQSVPVQGYSYSNSSEPAKDGYISYLKDWSEGGTNLVIIKDPTFPGGSVPDCLAENLENHLSCSGTPEEWHVMTPLFAAAKELARPNIHTVNLDSYFCGEGRCRAVIGGVVVYFDGSHITATYARTLAPYLSNAIRQAL
ncbi:acyltransferase family protein [Arthrobacter monumenti]